MSSAYCGACGAQIPADAKFCGSCGAAQTPVAPPAEAPPAAAAPPVEPAAATPPPASPPPQPPPAGAGQPRAGAGAAQRVENVAPDAREFAGALAGELSTPGAMLALTAGGIAAAAAIVVGFAAAIVSPDRSFIGLVGAFMGVFSEGINLSVATTMARIKGSDAAGISTLLPAIFVLAPLGGAIFGAWLQAPKTAGMSARLRVAWGAGAAIPLLVIMLILALVAKKTDEFHGFNIGSVMLLSLLWGALGGATGTLLSIRRTAPETLADVLPPMANRVAQVIRPALLSMAAMIASATLICLAVWEAQIIRGDDSVKAFRSTLTGIVESVLYAPNYGLSGANFGLFGQSKATLSIALPPTNTGPIKFPVRLFDYSDHYATWIFIPLLILLIGVPILLALYSGFATARTMAAPSLGLAAAWGALTGVVWAIALTIVCAIANVGALSGTLFGFALLVGAVFGALGGLLCGSRAAGGVTPPPVEGSPPPMFGPGR